MNRSNETSVRSVAAQVYDQDTHSVADLAFLDLMSKIDREWMDTVNEANIKWGGGSVAWEAVKNLATRKRDAAYAIALAAFEAEGCDEELFAEAAE